MENGGRIAQIVAIGAAVVLSVVIAGPAGGLEHLLRPLLGAVDAAEEHVTELAVGVVMAVLLVPGLLLWAWRPHLRPAGTAVTAVATVASTADVLLVAELFDGVVWWLPMLWVLAGFQVVRSRRLLERPQRPAMLIVATAAAAAPWVVQLGRSVLAVANASPSIASGASAWGATTVLAAVVAVLLAMPVVRLRTYMPAGLIGAAGALLFALGSLPVTEAAAALPAPLALLATVTVAAYVDVLRRLRRTVGLRLYDADEGR